MENKKVNFVLLQQKLSSLDLLFDFFFYSTFLMESIAAAIFFFKFLMFFFFCRNKQSVRFTVELNVYTYIHICTSIWLFFFFKYISYAYVCLTKKKKKNLKKKIWKKKWKNCVWFYLPVLYSSNAHNISKWLF